MNHTLAKKEIWHKLSTAEVIERLGASSAGFERAEVVTRLSEFGPNKMPEKKEKIIFKIILNQFKNPFAYILAIAGFISLILGSYIDATVVFVAIFLNVGIGFFQEWQASNIFQNLKKYVTFRALVRRDGDIRSVDTEEIVPGDIIILKQGERVPADARIIRATNLKTNEAILTGESMPVEKNIKNLPEKTMLADRHNMVFLGTSIEEGTGEAVVTATGSRTEFGKITAMMLGLTEEPTPLQTKIKKLAATLGTIFVLVAALLIFIGVFAGRDLFEMFLTAVAVAVAAVPESLPIALTVALAVGAKKIFQKGGLIKKMLAAEGLGGTDIVLADKTATLTEGRMSVVAIIDSLGRLIESSAFKSDDFLLKMLVSTSTATIEKKEDSKEERRIFGRPIDKAILESLVKIGLNREIVARDYPRLDEIPFDSSFKYSAVLNKFDEKKNIIVVLGAPEEIVRLSSAVSPWVLKKVEELTREGLRVLSLAFKYGEDTKLNRNKINNLIFAGIVIFSDPIRKGVKEAVGIAKDAGIRPIIVTGDHLLTANFVGREIGVLTHPDRSIEEKDLPENLEEIISDYDIFARVTPATKLKLTQAFQKNNHNVAVIGDGVNDAPALVSANIGVALGSGTDVAKDAADLVLIKDSFAVIVEAIRQGRIILDNIKKTATFLLSSSFSEIILISGSIIAGLPLALLPAQILWINIIQDGLPAIALAFEEEEDDIMRRQPVRKTEVFTSRMKWFIGSFVMITNISFFIFFVLLFQLTGNINYARTMIFVTFGLTSLIYVFSIKTFSRPVWKTNPFGNRFLNWSVVFGFGLYFLAIYWPPFQNIFSTTTLVLTDWLVLAGVSLFTVILIEIGKYLFFRGNGEKA